MARRTIVTGDIHGGLLALEQLLGCVGLRADDRLIFHGDYVDGWSGSAQAIGFLLALDDRHACIFIRDNHGTWCESWLRGEAPIASYAGVSNARRLPESCPRRMQIQSSIGKAIPYTNFTRPKKAATNDHAQSYPRSAF